MILLISLLLNFAQAETAPSQASAVVKNISIFRNEIQLGFEKSGQVKVGSKFIAKTAVNHKCLLIVTRVNKDLAYADANQCPGYATLKKGQTVLISPEGEVNEEVRVVPEKKEG